ncbi:MAG TPA: aldehyde dehydrogenase family protein, partial [Microthrixaceae bacterium]|nr:aldehyde dehydrogenase family protein [Microthrixaceae bacterium]
MADIEVRNQNFIGGRWAPARSGAMIDIVDPATGSTLFSSPDSGADDVDDACRAAADAFAEWGRT